MRNWLYENMEDYRTAVWGKVAHEYFKDTVTFIDQETEGVENALAKLNVSYAGDYYYSKLEIDYREHQLRCILNFSGLV